MNGLWFALLLVAQPVPSNVSVTTTSVGEYRGDNQNNRTDDDHFGGWQNRLNVLGTAGDFVAQTRLDSAVFVHAPTLNNNARLERFGLQYEHGAWRLQGGDGYVQLGRGIVLSVRKGDEVGVDMALRGGQVEYNAPVQQATLFAGVLNPANIDAVSQKLVADPRDLLAGGRWLYTGHEKFQLGLFGIYLQPHERVLPSQRDDTVSGGLHLDVPDLLGSALYVEADAQQRHLAGTSQVGKAAYVTLDTHVGPVDALLEGIYLNAFETLGSRNTATGARFAYNRPPTLERIQDEVDNNRDVLGGRLRLGHAWDNVQTSVQGLLKYNDFGQAAPVAVQHGYGGVEWNYDTSHLNGSAGYRRAVQNGTVVKTMAHVSMDWLQAMGRRLAAHVTLDHAWRTLDRRRYWLGTALVGVERAGWGELSFELGYDTQDPTVRRLFYAGIVTMALSDTWQLRALVGSQRGGIKCVSGVCREYPEFSGVRAELIVRL